MGSTRRIIKMVRESIEKYHVQITIATLVVLILFIITTTASLVSWKTNAENTHEALDVRQDHLVEGFNNVRANIEAIEARQNMADISTARIETKLQSIESLLVEIKLDLKAR